MSKKWILILLSLVILLPVMLLTIGVVVLNTADLKEHRETIAEHISQATGRQLSLNGELELNISTKLSIVVTDITLANAEWSSEPEMLAIQRVEAEITDGEVEIDRQMLMRAEVVDDAAPGQDHRRLLFCLQGMTE